MLRKIGVWLLLLMLLPGILLAAEVSLPTLYEDTYYAELPKMVQRLKEATGERLILIGGSSVPFGTDTALMEKKLAETGYPYTVCPMGLYAAVGSSAMLDLTEKELRSGDVVVLTFEAATETLSNYFGALAFWKCAETAPALLSRLGREKLAAMVGAYPGFLQERYGIWKSGEYPEAEGVYACGSFDETCNLTYPRAGNTMLLGYDPANTIDLDAISVDPEFSNRVNHFIRTAQNAGAKVFLSFAPMNRSAMADFSEETVYRYFEKMRHAFHCPVISNPNDSILDSGWFYDSNFHLNTAGAALHTQRLTADILAALGCCKPLDWETPAMPAAAVAAENTGGDNAFVYTPFHGGFLISGLSDPTADVLMVPSHYEGLPVVGFTPDALAQAECLRELNLPSTIQFLPDSLFQYCVNLSRLVLNHTDAPCSITAHSLDGTANLQIYVPQSAYHLYRDGIGCGINPWEDYLHQIHTF